MKLGFNPNELVVRYYQDHLNKKFGVEQEDYISASRDRSTLHDDKVDLIIYND